MRRREADVYFVLAMTSSLLSSTGIEDVCEVERHFGSCPGFGESKEDSKRYGVAIGNFDGKWLLLEASFSPGEERQLGG